MIKSKLIKLKLDAIKKHIEFKFFLNDENKPQKTNLFLSLQNLDQKLSESDIHKTKVAKLYIG